MAVGRHHTTRSKRGMRRSHDSLKSSTLSVDETQSIIKAIKSSGYKKVIPFNKIEIINSEFGAPNVLLDIDLLGDCKVSISHTNTHAVAMAIFISA